MWFRDWVSDIDGLTAAQRRRALPVHRCADLSQGAVGTHVLVRNVCEEIQLPLPPSNVITSACNPFGVTCQWPGCILQKCYLVGRLEILNWELVAQVTEIQGVPTMTSPISEAG